MRKPVALNLDLPALLASDEPPAWEHHPAAGDSPVLILCDHASNRIPCALGDLGVPPEEMQRHIAYDIGALGVSRILARTLGCALVHSNYSRLVIDPNRHPGDGSSIPEVSDGTEIPGNQGLSREQVQQREQELFWSYHNAVAKTLERMRAAGGTPVILSIHSFTPCFRGFQRPWHIGVLWDRDDRLARPMLQVLNREQDICAGDNEPYHARNPQGFSMEIHCERNGYPHLLLEIRQDLISDEPGIELWAQRLSGWIAEVVDSLPAG